MSGFPTVARVLLVAASARERELAPSLRVVGEPARYELECLDPAWVGPRPDPAWTAIVVDGPSIATDDAREQLFRRMSGQQLTTLLYIANRLPAEVEVQQAFAWADDVIDQGWEFGDRLRRRVQCVALAPWRRSMALRAEAERLGDRRLRVMRFAEVDADAHEELTEPPCGHLRRLDRAMPFVLAEQAWRLGGSAPSLVAAAFHEGRRIGVSSTRESAEAVCDLLLEELNRVLEGATPELVREMEATFRAASGSPLVAARFGGAAFAIGVVRDELRRLARHELAAIERHAVRSGHEP